MDRFFELNRLDIKIYNTNMKKTNKKELLKSFAYSLFGLILTPLIASFCIEKLKLSLPLSIIVALLIVFLIALLVPRQSNRDNKNR
ncbi:hypothetical protein ATX71_08945 [Oenococcus oeni]|uniref:Uncharacterized protein n=4 Tax=Oenococcus oeni TaxID=1247 RepID=Q04D09_OENOB|nr:hypothetical protein OEOE_1828 [Oenococcus oeni PSU-1]AWW98821.1 hypothetical protein C5H79_04580 [Oenococcus oeni]EJN91503.1 hypothetical protein AWRIB304_1693 [Oenococcus oeni AWRIB304]EJN99680.1 hypothetical protein AWRIB419_1415 [Oenococcus oeni AWRIB419]EJO03055.1 hypothetical protein AWRIB318_240 [Oenococcus oeni AWRIB318]EJO04618.1 hypothetical protein AWRIB422_1573 [Oenococcus oeni AWRIB422]EJO06611.1 hypothetical protein AWRIB548_642 [Oenococcus oeni AWRIB548]EJO07524.1 hypotheti